MDDNFLLIFLLLLFEVEGAVFLENFWLFSSSFIYKLRKGLSTTDDANQKT